MPRVRIVFSCLPLVTCSTEPSPNRRHWTKLFGKTYFQTWPTPSLAAHGYVLIAIGTLRHASYYNFTTAPRQAFRLPGPFLWTGLAPCYTAAMQIEMRPTESIKPYDRNPRKNDDAVKAVERSIREFGFRQPIVVDEHGVIVVGHTRWKAAQSLGLPEVPVHVAVGLTPQQIRAYRIADNKTNEYAEWNVELLATEVEALRLDEYDLSQLALSESELKALDKVGDAPAETLNEIGGLEYRIVVDCQSEQDQTATIERLEREGRKCRALIS